jgi:serine/threonine protein kinase
MGITTQALREWLERRFDGYSLEAEPKKGTYGIVFFLTSKSPHICPRSFAVKTVDPEKIAEGLKKNEDEVLRREFRMWLALPQSYNVLPALGFDIATLSESTQNKSIDLPVMRMPRMKGSLKEWITKPTPDQIPDRLIALSQALNGLQYLYDHGFQGHGDLKPDNLLYDDLRNRFLLDDQLRWPSTIHPWRICVADLGWADAWAAVGRSTGGGRPYLALERIGPNGTFVPVKSDMFSMGVIASELLQGSHPHPAKNPNNLKKENWRKWHESGDRNLKDLQPPGLQRIVERCLDPCPDSRPDALEFLNEICAELKSTYDLDIAGTLRLWRLDHPVAQNEHYAWAAVQSQRLGADQSRVSLKDVTKRLQQANVVDFETSESWVPLAESFVCLAEGNPDLLAQQNRIRNLALKYLQTILGTLDQSGISQLPSRSDWSTLREFERFSWLVKRLADLAGITATNGSEFLQELGSYARSALYYAWASAVHGQEGNDQAAIEMLSSAIAEAPNEPVNYYFRAFWTHESRIFQGFFSSQADASEPSSIEEMVNDLEMAIRLDPDWKEPERLLEKLRGERSA